MQMLYFSEVQLSVPEPSQATHLPSAAARLATHFSSAAPLQANYLPSAAHPQSTNFPSAVHPQPTNLVTAHLPGQPISHQRTATDLPHPTVYPRAINRSSAAPLWVSRPPSAVEPLREEPATPRPTVRHTPDRETAPLTNTAFRRTNATYTLTGGGSTDEASWNTIVGFSLRRMNSPPPAYRVQARSGERSHHHTLTHRNTPNSNLIPGVGGHVISPWDGGTR